MIVFAPHPDDETLGCGGTIAKKSAEGYVVFIVIITDGRHAFSKKYGKMVSPNPEEVKDLRKKELIEAVNLLGVPTKNLFFLGFEDGTLSSHEQEAEKEIIEILKMHSAAEIYFPYFKDSHPDHRATNRLVRNCLRKSGLSSAKFQYSIYFKHSRIGPRIERSLNYFKKCTIKVDISKYLDLKMKAIDKFRTEVLPISNTQKRPIVDNVDKFLNYFEEFYIDDNNPE
jgi:LmbE family N-acetylglucosaminyl deacetylase